MTGSSAAPSSEFNSATTRRPRRRGGRANRGRPEAGDWLEQTRERVGADGEPGDLSGRAIRRADRRPQPGRSAVNIMIRLEEDHLKMGAHITEIDRTSIRRSGTGNPTSVGSRPTGRARGGGTNSFVDPRRGTQKRKQGNPWDGVEREIARIEARLGDQTELEQH